MDNVPSSADKHIISVRSFLKAAASATTVGAMVVSLMNDEQTKNIEDTLQKHQEQIMTGDCPLSYRCRVTTTTTRSC